MTSTLGRYVKRQLPLIDAVDVESTTWYALRMTPMEQYTEEILINFIMRYAHTYIMVSEISSKEKLHYHIVLQSSLDEEELREQIRHFLKEQFPGPAKRGDANKQYNLSECIDHYDSVVYLLKDQDLSKNKIFSMNIDLKYLEELKSKSYKKYDSKEFGEKLKEIKDYVKEHPEISIEDIMERIVRLKTIYRQPINMNYIYQLSSTLHLHNRPELIRGHVQNFLSRLL